jgi:predicted nucleic acid-binding Zn ribbon protein
MPTYIYETLSDQPGKVKRYEIEQRMSAAPLERHPETKEAIRRVITGGLGFIGAEHRGSSPAPATATGGGCGTSHCGHTHH